jgi:trans-aconitate methyltransferase
MESTMRQEPKSEDAWNAELYAAHSAHHRQQDASFLASVVLAPTDRVVDLGCGTGEFTNQLAALVPEGAVFGIDASASQVARASAKRSANVRLVVGRLQDLDEVLQDESFHAAVSRATLHWVPKEEHPALLRVVRKHLRPGGFLRAEFGGRGQMQDALSMLDEVSESLGGPVSPWFFPEADEYADLVDEAGLTAEGGFVRLLPQRRAMPTFEALRGFLRSQAFVGYEMGLRSETRTVFREVAESRAARELRRSDGSYDLEFVRLDLLAFTRAAGTGSTPPTGSAEGQLVGADRALLLTK